MSFFSRLKSSAESVTATQPLAPAAPEPAPPAPILPPDAPEPSPERSAVPVTQFEAVPAKRGRGRPPGSKNKPKMKFVDEPSQPPTEVQVVKAVEGVQVVKEAVAAVEEAIEAVVEARPSPKGFTVKSVTVGKGVTINLGSFNSVRFDVSMTAEGEDYEATYSALLDEVNTRLEAEAAKYATDAEAGKR